MRFIHAGDFHLDSAFGALSSEKALLRRQEGRELVSALADYVNENTVDLVLLSGDLLDSEELFSQTSKAVAAALGRMQAQVVIAPGNHDFCGGNSFYRILDWSDNVHVFKNSTMETLEFPHLNATVSGAGFTQGDHVDGALSGWSMPADGWLHFGVLHGDMRSGDSRYNPITKDDVAQSGFCYLGLGHVHKRSEPAILGKTMYAYSGCLEGRGFDELGQKGFYQGDVDERGVVQLSFVPFGRRRSEVITVNVTGQAPLDAIEKALPQDTQSHLYRILLTGETDAEGVNVATLQSGLESQFFALEIRDETTIAQDVWVMAGEDSLRGLFLQELKAKLDTATTDQDRHAITLAARYGLAALDNRDML